MPARHRWAVGLLVAFTWLCGCQSRLAGRLDGILNRQAATGARFTARVLELPSRRELYAHDIDTPFIPASNLKLFTSTSGLDLLGPDYVFKTWLALDGEDLWVIGSGDPGIGDEKVAAKYNEKMTTVFDEWALELRKRGIGHIKGKLYYYQGNFDSQWVYPRWNKSFLVDWYAAPVTGLNFNTNCAEFTVYPTEAGELARYEFRPPVKNIKVVNQCISASTRPADIDRERDANEFILKGGCTKKTELSSKPVMDPGAFFADALRTHLESRGIVIDGPSVESKSTLGSALEPPADKLIAVHETKIVDVMWRINKNSQNLFAEALSKTTGQHWRARRGEQVSGSWQDGSAAAHQFLKSHGIEDSKIVMADGSGLSRDNHVTARAITDLLAVMSEHPSGAMFRNSLGVAGVDGTISKRMKDIAGMIQAKTGYIGGVRSLSGYAQTREGKTLVFCFIYNNIPEPPGVKPFEEMQDDACRVLVSWPNLESTPPAFVPASAPATMAAP